MKKEKEGRKGEKGKVKTAANHEKYQVVVVHYSLGYCYTEQFLKMAEKWKTLQKYKNKIK